MWWVVDCWPWEGCGSAEMVLELTNLSKLCILSEFSGKSSASGEGRALN